MEPFDCSTLDPNNLPAVLTPEMLECLTADLPPEPPPPTQAEIDKQISEAARLVEKVAKFLFDAGADQEIVEFFVGPIERKPKEEKREPPGRIDHKDFPGMGESMQAKLAAAGVTTVRDLVDLGVRGIDELPVGGIGKSKAEGWFDTAVALTNAADTGATAA